MNISTLSKPFVKHLLPDRVRHTDQQSQSAGAGHRRLASLLWLLLMLVGSSFVNAASVDAASAETINGDTASADSIRVTVYADSSYPPYSYAEGNQVRGLYTQILRTAFSRMPDYQVDIQPVPWKRGLKLLQSGGGFALYPPYFRLQQRPWIWPYSLPLADEKVVIFCREGLLDEGQLQDWPRGYYGLNIGINAGFQLGGEEFWQAVKEGHIRVQEAPGNRENLNILGVARTDCYINDRLSIVLELQRLKAEGKYLEGSKHARLVEGATITLEQGFVGYTGRDDGRFPFKADFQKQLDTQIYNMRRSGELQRMIDSFGVE